MGLYSGAIYLRLGAYARAAPIVNQGKGILREIENYKTRHGELPDQHWFNRLDAGRITIEKRVWDYHNPPFKSPSGKLVIISVPVDRNNSYLYGFTEGYVIGGSYVIQVNNEQLR